MGLVVAGNWKMNHGPRETRTFFREMELPTDTGEVTVLIFPPAISLAAAVAESSPAGSIRLGVQNIHRSATGAFTGEISAEMAREAGAEYALVGHSERRHLFGETDAETAAKVGAAHRTGLIPLLCVGETREERQAGKLAAVLRRQLDAVLGPDAEGDPAPLDAPLLLAYEPVWAIGTGDTATPEDAEEAHGILRARMEELLPPAIARRVPILYGGSVTPSNASDLLSTTGVDGALIGGASLDPASFSSIVRTALALC